MLILCVANIKLLDCRSFKSSFIEDTSYMYFNIVVDLIQLLYFFNVGTTRVNP